MFVFGAGPPPADLAVPAGAFRSCRVQRIERAQDPAWFDAWRSGSLRAIAKQDLGELAALDAADQVHVVACEPTAVTDLGYLEGAWAVVRALTDAGATVVLDAMAMSYTPAARVPAAGAALEVAREVRVVFETDSTRSDRAHALHTRGLRKFGAPDLVALCTDADVELVGAAIRELAEEVACGLDLALPRHALEIAPGVRWVAIEDEHRIGELLQLNNEARVLVDDRGKNLTGVAQRAPAPR